MPTATQVFRALITADADGAVTELKKFDGQVDKAVTGTAKKTDQLGAAFTKVGKAVAGLGVAKVMHDSIDAASDLDESINAVNVTFGDASAGVRDLGKNSVDAFGLSERAFNQAAVQFSGFAKQVTGDGGNVAATIQEMTTRAADFASVHNLEMSDAIQIFQSTLAGETEAMRRYGKDVSAAAVEAYALANGLAATKGEITETIKVQARYGLLMQQTEEWAGDWANTSDSLANRQRKLTGEIENVSAKLGKQLVPAAASATDTVGDLLGVLDAMPESAQSAVVAAAAVAVGLATIGKSATLAVGSVLALAGAYQAVKGGATDMDAYLDSDVAFYEKPFQQAGRYGRLIGESLNTGRRVNRLYAESVENADAAVMAFDRSLFMNVETVDDAREVAQEYASALGGNVDQLHVVNSLVVEYARTNGLNAEAQAKAAHDALMNTEAMRDQSKAANHTATVLGQLEARQIAAAEATERHRAAMADLFDEVNNNLSTMFDYEEATLDLSNSAGDYANQQADLEDILNDSTKTTEEKAEALRDLRLAEIDIANQALATSAAYAESQGAIEGTTQFAMLQREELGRLAEQFPFLNDELAGFIAELDRIPAVKTVSLIVNRNATNAQIAAAGSSVRVDEFGNLRGYDTGGVVPGPRGSAQLAVVHGGETILPTHKVPASAVAAGGVRDVHVHVGNVFGADMDHLSRLVREAVRRETRFNGPITGWAA